jgi:hypothetical protein
MVTRQAHLVRRLLNRAESTGRNMVGRVPEKEPVGSSK